MIRFLSIALLALFPAIVDACPLKTRSYPPGTVILYQSGSCCWGSRRVQVFQVVEAKPAEVVKKPEPWVTIKGRIVWDKSKGEVPKRVPIKATIDAAVANKDGDFYTEDWVVDENNLGIKNVIVWLAPEPSAETLQGLKDRKIREFPSFSPAEMHPTLREASSSAVVIDIPHCRFIPHVVTARAGQSLIINNSSVVPQNAKLTSQNNGDFNRLLAPGGPQVLENLKPERMPIVIDCSIHPWMRAYVRVFDHPYFAVTDVNGNFEIKNAPVMGGKLRLFMWQESSGYHRGAEGRFGQTIAVKGGIMDLKEIKFDTAQKK
jgi:hypothetical protein